MRWRLTAAHYLNIRDQYGQSPEWEQKEINRDTGKQAIRRYPVPALLDPDQGADCNYPGEIIVCHDGKGERNDIVIFNGDGSPGHPTPDMEPLDDEAKALSDELRHKWTHPIETLPTTMSPGEEAFMKMLMKAASAQPTSVSSIDPTAFAALQEQVAQLMAQNAELKAALPARRA